MPALKILSLAGAALLVSVVGCSLFSTTNETELEATEPESSSWYNQTYLRSVFGDFDKTDRIELRETPGVAELREHGRYLVESVAACGSCHGLVAGDPSSALAGGRPMRDRFGLVQAANITPHPETGIGEWNLFELMRAIRASIDREGRPISIDLHSGFRWMADRDAKAIAIYLLSLKPVQNSVTRRRLGGFERNKWGLFPQHSDLAGYIPTMNEAPSVARGRYLANNVSQCSLCHSSAVGEFRGFENKGGILALFREIAELVIGGEESYEESVAAFLSPEGRRIYEARIEASGTQETKAARNPTADNLNTLYTEALLAGEYPVGGPDIRSGSPDGGLASWSNDAIVSYLTTGHSSGGELREGRFCPWPFYKGMKQGDLESIALYLKKLS